MLLGGTNPVTPGPTKEKKRNKLSTRTTEDTLLWAVGLGIGSHLGLTDGTGDAMLGKLCCTLCGCWLSMMANVLKVHVLGRNIKAGGLYERRRGAHKQKVENLCATPPILFGGGLKSYHMQSRRTA